MTLDSPTQVAAGQDAAQRHVLAVAGRTWRAAGVRRDERQALLSELSDEIAAAAAEGRRMSDVIGDDPRQTLGSWAIERGVAGRSLRLGVLAPLALTSIGLGSLVLIVWVLVTFTVPGAAPAAHQAIVFAALVSGCLGSLVLAVLSCWAVLHSGRDPRARATAGWLLACLPLGAFVALALTVITAAAFSYEGRAIPTMAVVIAITFTAAVAAARLLAIRFTRLPR